MKERGLQGNSAEQKGWAGELKHRARDLMERGLISSEHAGLLGSFAEEVRRLVSGRAGEGAEIVVTSAVPLSDEHRATVEKRLAARFGGGSAVRYRVDPQILGGILIRAGDQIIDGSVAGKLDALKKSILETV